MEEGQDLDNYFKNKLKDYSRNPPERVWKNVSQRLEKQPRNVSDKTYIYRHYIRMAASVILAISAGLFTYRMATEDRTEVVSAAKPLNDSLSQAGHIKENKVAASKVDTMAAKQYTAEKPKAAKSEKREEMVTVIATDGKKVFSLPDSSTVYLNKNSKLAYAAGFKTRKVKLLKGEAYFEVRKMDDQRFSVFANKSLTTVYGTSFMVTSDPAGVEDIIYVTSGKVAVAELDDTSKKIFLFPGEKCRVNKGGVLPAEKISDLNYHAWQDEEIVFNNTGLGTVVKTLEEYYGVSIQIKNPDILKCYFTGKFKKSGINDVLQVLAATFNLAFDDRQGAYVLSGKGCK